MLRKLDTRFLGMLILRVFLADVLVQLSASLDLHHLFQRRERHCHCLVYLAFQLLLRASRQVATAFLCAGLLNQYFKRAEGVR